jgi:hypothetical protein
VIIERHRRTQIHADVKGLGGGEDHRHRIFKATLPRPLAVDPEGNDAAGSTPSGVERSASPAGESG